MLFKDRYDAGEKLSLALKEYQNAENTIVIGLPRGGVATAYEVATRLELPLDIVCPRKIGAPANPEFAVGAITETGDHFLNESVIKSLDIPKDELSAIIENEREVAKNRLKDLREGLPKRKLKGKVVIVVDDGLATGSTMKAALITAKKEGAEKIVAAVPVAPADSLEKIQELADEVICLETPPFFQAVSNFYDDFASTSDEEVKQLLTVAKDR